MTIKWDDGLQGWSEQAPFDRLILTAAIKEIPKILFDQMADNGIVIAPVGNRSDDLNLVKFFRRKDGEWEQESLLPVRFVPMLGGTVDANAGP